MLKRIIYEVKKYEYKIDLVWFVLFPLFNIVYILANHIYKKGFDLTIALDTQIPLVSIFVVPYIYWYIYMIVGYFLISINNRKEYMRSILGLFLGMWISYIIYFIFPTEIARPNLVDSSFFNRILNIIYAMDRPFNCFPSLHVLGTYFVMRYTKKENNKYIYFYTKVVGILIILSTVFIKQHFVLDVVAAIVLVEIINIIVRKISDERLEKCLKVPYLILEKVTRYSRESVGISSNDEM